MADLRMVERVLALDVGSSALKAVLFGREGDILASSEAGYPAARQAHRQDPEGWWSAAGAAIAALGAGRIDALVLTGSMENLIPVDRTGRALCDAIMYSDPCGAEALEAMRPELARLAASAVLGNEPEPLMTAFKLAWLRQTHPALFDRADFFLPGAKDAIALRLTGRAVTDPVTATTTGLMDVLGRRWSAPLLAAFGIEIGRLPIILPADAVIGPVLPQAAAELGLDPEAGISVVNGCGDAGATTLGSFCRERGDISLYLGTTGWLARVAGEAEARDIRPVYRLAHPSPELLIEITPILSAGAAGAWVRKNLGFSDTAAEAALRASDAAPPDLLFLPYLAGERSPFMDAGVRGAFLGLDSAHDAAALYYAVLEGVAFAIRANLDIIDPGGAGPIRLVGGGSRSGVWPLILADVLGRPIWVAESASVATATGAFLIAARSFGLPQAAEAAGQLVAFRPERRARIRRLAAAFGEATQFARGLRLGADRTMG